MNFIVEIIFHLFLKNGAFVIWHYSRNRLHRLIIQKQISLHYQTIIYPQNHTNHIINTLMNIKSLSSRVQPAQSHLKTNKLIITPQLHSLHNQQNSPPPIKSQAPTNTNKSSITKPKKFKAQILNPGYSQHSKRIETCSYEIFTSLDKTITQNFNIADKGSQIKLPNKSYSNQIAQNTIIQNNITSSHIQDLSNANCAKWLDNQKEMMEFIMALKSRKSSGLIGKRKSSEGFEMDQRSDEKEQWLCHKLLVIKRVQKHQKEAINSFYAKDYEQSFQQLFKAEALLKKQNVQSPPHILYINYLHAQFYYKLADPRWKIYLTKAKTCTGKIQEEDIQSMQYYIWGIKALQACLALQNEQYDKILLIATQFRALHGKNRRIRRRVSLAQIVALQKKKNANQALKVIQEQLLELEEDTEINITKRYQDRCKLLTLKINIWLEFGSRKEAINIIQQIIKSQQTILGQQRPSFYNYSIYESYSQLLKQEEGVTIKFLYLYQRWIEIEPAKKQKVRLQLQLFKFYFQIGIYQRALQLFQDISSQNIIYLGPEYLYNLSQIKHFQGEEEQAISIASKIIDITNQQSKLFYSFKILELNLSSQERLEREKYLQKMMKTFQKAANFKEVLQLYRDYLRRRGRQKSVLSKAEKGYSLCDNYQRLVNG